MIYSAHYSIWHTFDLTGIEEEYINYSILINQQTIDRGRVYKKSPSDTEITIDIAPICREYLDTYYENITFSNTISSSVPTNGNIRTINTFSIESIDDTASYTVAYDYNTDYVIVNDLDYANLNEPILYEVDPRQRIGISGYNIGGPTTYNYSINGGSPIGTSINSQLYQLYNINLNNLVIAEGSTIEFTQTPTNKTERMIYKVVPPCKDRYVLYYVNKYGGLDYLLCGGTHQQSWNPQRTDVRLYKDRNNPRTFEQTRIYQEIDKQYQLNTLWIPDNQAERIDNLIYSPKVWIHDLDKDLIMSCLITDSTYQVKSERNDRLISYRINVKLSQKELRK